MRGRHSRAFLTPQSPPSQTENISSPFRLGAANIQRPCADRHPVSRIHFILRSGGISVHGNPSFGGSNLPRNFLRRNPTSIHKFPL
jgi:hypothetical protein